MTNPMTSLVLYLSLILGTTLTLSSHHWLLAWLGLEINTLAIIPLMIKTPHPRATEAAMKYFLVQSSASATILCSTTINAWINGTWFMSMPTHSTVSTLITLALAMKLGVAPFHFWLPEVLQGLPLKTGLIILTWQKIAPLAILFQSYHSVNSLLLLSLGALSTMIGGIGGLNQSQLRKIMAYSSMSHMGWIIAAIKPNAHFALISFLIYLLLTTTLFLIFMHLNVKSISELAMTSIKNPILIALTMLTVLSLGGLPPLTGLTPKIIIVFALIQYNSILCAALMLTATLLSLFYYLRLTYLMIIMMNPYMTCYPTLWQRKKKFYLALMATLSLTLLPFTPTALNLNFY